MTQFSPGENKTAKAAMRNPTAKVLDYTGCLYLGTDLAVMAEVTFSLSAGEEKQVSFPVVTPSLPGTYPVYLGVFSDGQNIALYRGEEDITVVAPGLQVGPIIITHVNGSPFKLITREGVTLYAPGVPKKYTGPGSETLTLTIMVKESLLKPSPPETWHPQQYFLVFHASYPDYHLNAYRGMANTIPLAVGTSAVVGINSLWGQGLEGAPTAGLYDIARLIVDLWMYYEGDYYSQASYGTFTIAHVLQVD